MIDNIGIMNRFIYIVFNFLLRELTLKDPGAPTLNCDPGAPTLKLLYLEKSRHQPTLKILDGIWKIFAKYLGQKISSLTAWRLPENPGWPKKCKNVPICQNNTTFLSDKALK